MDDLQEPEFRIKYTFSDFLRDAVPAEPTDYINEYKIKVYFEHHGIDSSELVAKARVSIILFSLAMDNVYPMMDVMDATQPVLGMSEVIFDFGEEGDPWEKLDLMYEEEPLLNNNVCLIERLEILPEYRGLGIGEKIVRNIAERFYESCGLIVANALPLSVMNIDENPRKWMVKMGLNKFGNDEEKANYKLYDFYQKLGFSNPFNENYFIAKPSQIVYT